MVRYVEALIYQSVAENIASEQSARMVAMKAASDNAKKLIEELQLVYNKTRQAGITKEISEIVGGCRCFLTRYVRSTKEPSFNASALSWISSSHAIRCRRSTTR